MKRVLTLALGVAVLSIGMTSCFKHHVCATYTKNVPQIEKTVADEVEENI